MRTYRRLVLPDLSCLIASVVMFQGHKLVFPTIPLCSRVHTQDLASWGHSSKTLDVQTLYNKKKNDSQSSFLFETQDWYLEKRLRNMKISTVNFLNIRTTEIFAAITLKVEQNGVSLE